MSLKEKMEEFGLTERKLMYNSDYSIEYFTFNRNSAIKALCYLISNSKKSIKIYHKILSDFEKNLKTNRVIKALHDNTNTKIEYYTKFSLAEEKIVKEYIGDHVEVKSIELGYKKYHHKEMIIDDKYLIITTLNFLTNNLIDDINNRNFWLENFSIWVKRSEK